MATRSSPGSRVRPRASDFTVALTQRFAWLMRSLEPKERALVRAMPALLCGRFRKAGFDREGPGLEQVSRRRRWGTLFDRLGWLPPQGFTSARPLVSSVLLAPRGVGAFALVVVPAPELGADEPRLALRLAALANAVQLKTPRLSVERVDPLQLSVEDAAFAGLVCGGAPRWPISSAPGISPASLAHHAPTPLARVLSLLVDKDLEHPALALASRRLTDASPEAFLAQWTADPSAHECVALTRVGGVGAAQVLSTSHTLQRACLAALRRATGPERSALAALVRKEVIRQRVALPLRAELWRALQQTPLEQVRTLRGSRLEVQGHVLAQGRTDDEALLRGAFESDAVAVPQRLSRLVPLLELTQRRVLALIGPGAAHEVVLIGGGRRPRLEQMETNRLVGWAAVNRLRGLPVELEGRHPNPTVRGLLARVAAIPLEGKPLAVELDGQLVVATKDRARIYSTERFFRRPRKVQLLTAAPARQPRPVPPCLVPTVFAQAHVEGNVAWVTYVDCDGHLLWEKLPAHALEPSLDEAAQVLAATPTSPRLSVTVEDAPRLLGKRWPLSGEVVQFSANVIDGRRPSAAHDGEHFGSDANGYRAAAELVLSRWPLGASGRIAVTQVTMSPPEHAAGLWALAVRAHVRSRLEKAVARLSALLEAA